MIGHKVAAHDAIESSHVNSRISLDRQRVEGRSGGSTESTREGLAAAAARSVSMVIRPYAWKSREGEVVGRAESVAPLLSRDVPGQRAGSPGRWEAAAWTG